MTLFHASAAVWIGAMLLFGRIAPVAYRSALQEDRLVEWATVWLFGAAGIVGAAKAVRRRRPFDGLVAVFCLFVAGEEFSWGQRLLGYQSPEFFLAHNFQQEVTLHNLAQAVLQPKWVLAAALAAYGLLLPAAGRLASARTLLARAGATAPPVALAPWFAASIALLAWYPLTLTGEWVECLAGGLFLMALRPAALPFLAAAGSAAIFGAAMSAASGVLEQQRDTGPLACAAAEVRGLVDDVSTGRAVTARVGQMDRVHKRVWSSIGEYLDAAGLRAFAASECHGTDADALAHRRKFGIDPWGSPYWVLIQTVDGRRQQVTVYSFGPNRRRDIDPVSPADGAPGGDDVVLTAPILTTPTFP